MISKITKNKIRQLITEIIDSKKNKDYLDFDKSWFLHGILCALYFEQKITESTYDRYMSISHRLFKGVVLK